MKNIITISSTCQRCKKEWSIECAGINEAIAYLEDKPHAEFCPECEAGYLTLRDALSRQKAEALSKYFIPAEKD